MVLEERTDRFVNGLTELLKEGDESSSAKRVTKALLNNADDMKGGYREACASSTPEQFIERLALVARQAKRVKASLVMLVQLGHSTSTSPAKPFWKHELSKQSSPRRETPPGGATAAGWFYGESLF